VGEKHDRRCSQGTQKGALARNHIAKERKKAEARLPQSVHKTPNNVTFRRDPEQRDGTHNHIYGCPKKKGSRHAIHNRDTRAQKTSYPLQKRGGRGGTVVGKAELPLGRLKTTGVFGGLAHRPWKEGGRKEKALGGRGQEQPLMRGKKKPGNKWDVYKKSPL